MEPIAGIHIDRVGSLKEWYRDALCNIFWYKCIALLRDPSQPIPERPNPTAGYNPRRSTRNRFARQQAEQNGTEGHSGTDREEDGTHGEEDREPNVSPRGSRRRREQPREDTSGDNRDYNPANVGETMFDSLRIFNLGYAATYPEVKAEYRRLARIYHPDKHCSNETGMNDDDAKIFFQLLNNAHAYLKTKL
jgi:hypothetical protein